MAKETLADFVGNRSKTLKQREQEVEDASFLDRLKDFGIDATKATLTVPESIIGLADIPTGGRVGKFIEDYTPVQFEETRDILNQAYSPERQQEQREISQAYDESFFGGLKKQLSEPASAVGMITESAPLMLGGRAIATKLLQRGLKSPTVAAGVGEGLVTAGAQETGIRNETEDGLTSFGQGAAALGSGFVTGLLGGTSNKLSQKLGLADIDVGGTAGRGSAVKRILGGTAMEGVAEELPQSVQEKMFENLALDKPLTEGIKEAGGSGLISGAAMGAGMNTTQVLMDRQKQKVAEGEESGNLIEGEPTLDEQKATVQAEKQTVDPVTEAAEGLGAKPEDIDSVASTIVKKVKNAAEFTRELVARFGEAAKKYALKLYNYYQGSKLGEERGSFSSKSKLAMQPDNIEKIKAGQKTATTRTFPVKPGRYALPDGTEVETRGGTRPLHFKDLKDPEAYARAEGFESIDDMRKNAKFKSTKDFLHGKRPLYISTFSLVNQQEDTTAQQADLPSAERVIEAGGSIIIGEERGSVSSKKKPINIYSTDKNGFETLSNLKTPSVKANIFGNDAEFKTVEHLYQAKKAEFANDKETARKIYTAKNGFEAKRLGSQIKGLNKKAWDSVAKDVLAESMDLAFQQNPDHMKKLLDTGEAEITHTKNGASLGRWSKDFPEILKGLREKYKSEGILTESQADLPSAETVTPPSQAKAGFKLSTDKLGKDQGKADKANAFIGYGVESRKSSTGTYLEDAKKQGVPTNENISPTKDTVAFVSVASEGTNNAKTVEDAKRVIEAGGSIIMDSRGTEKGQSHSSFNKKGEGQVQDALEKLYGKPEKTEDGYSLFKKKPAETDAPIPEDFVEMSLEEFMAQEEQPELTEDEKISARAELVDSIVFFDDVNEEKQNSYAARIGALQRKLGLSDDYVSALFEEVRQSKQERPVEAPQETPKETSKLIRRRNGQEETKEVLKEDLDKLTSQERQSKQHKGEQGSESIGTKRSTSFDQLRKIASKAKKVTTKAHPRMEQDVRSRKANKRNGAYVYNKSKDTQELSRTVDGAVYVNKAKAKEFLQNGTSQFLPKDLKESISSLGINAGEFSRVFKDDTAFTDFLINREKAKSIKQDSIEAALSPAEVFKLQKIQSDRKKAGPVYQGKEGGTAKPKKADLSLETQKDKLTNSLLSEKEIEAVRDERSTEAIKELNKNYDPDDVPARPFTTQDGVIIEEDPDTPQNRGSRLSLEDKETARESQNQEAMSNKLTERLSGIRSTYQINIKLGTDRRQNKSHAFKVEDGQRVPLEVNDLQNKALKDAYAELKKNKNFTTKANAPAFAKDSKQGEQTTSYAEIILSDLISLAQKGIYIPDVISKIKKDFGVSSLSDVQNGDFSMLDDLHSFLETENVQENHEERIQKKWDAWKKDVQEVRQEIKKQRKLSNQRALQGDPVLSENLSKEEIAKRKEAKRKAEEAYNQELIKKFNAKTKNYKLFPGLVKGLLSYINETKNKGYYNEVKVIRYDELAKHLSKNFEESALDFKNLSQKEQEQVAKDLLYVVNNLRNIPFSNYMYDQNITDVDGNVIGPSIAAEIVDMQSYPPLIDNQLHEIVIDQVSDEAMASYRVVNTKGSYFHHVFYFDSYGKPQFKMARNFNEIKELEKLQAQKKISGLQQFNRMNLESSRAVAVVQFKNKEGDTYEQVWPLVSYARSVGSGTFKGTLLRIERNPEASTWKKDGNSPAEFLASWESTQDQKAMMDAAIIRAEASDVISLEAAEVYQETLKQIETASGEQLLDLTTRRLFGTTKDGIIIGFRNKEDLKAFERDNGKLGKVSYSLEKTQAEDFRHATADVLSDFAPYQKLLQHLDNYRQKQRSVINQRLKDGKITPDKRVELYSKLEEAIAQTHSKEINKKPLLDKIRKKVEEQYVEKTASMVRDEFIKDSMKNSILLDTSKIDEIVEKYKEHGITKEELIKTYITAKGPNRLRVMYSRIGQKIRETANLKTEKLAAQFRKAGNTPTAKTVREYATRDMDAIEKSRYEEFQNGTIKNITLEEKIVFAALSKLETDLMQPTRSPVTLDEKTKKRIEEAIRNSAMKRQELREISIATAKAEAGLSVAPEDIVHEKPILTAFEKRLKEFNPNMQISLLRDKATRAFYESIAKIFNAELVVVSDLNYQSRYVPGETSRLVININNGTKFAKIFGHELFHHIKNRATKAEKEAFDKALAKFGRSNNESLTGRYLAETEDVEDYVNKQFPLGNEEVQSDIFAEVFTHQEFHKVLAETAAGQSMSRRIIKRLLSLGRRVGDLFSKHVKDIHYEKNSYIAQSDLLQVYELFASLALDAHKNTELSHRNVQYLQGAATKEAFNGLKDKSRWFTGFFKKIFTHKGRVEAMNNFEKILHHAERWLVDAMPQQFLADFRSNINAKKLANNFINRGGWESERAYHRALKKHKKTFENMSNAEMERINDFFARGIVITNQKQLDKVLEKIRMDYVSNKLSKSQYKNVIEKAYKNFSKKVKEDGSGINLGKKEDVALAREYGFSDDVIKAFVDYRKLSDRTYLALKKNNNELDYRPDHYGQSIRWFKKDGGLVVEDDIGSVIKQERWEMFRNDNLPIAALKEIHEIHYRSVNPNYVMQEYIRDAYKLVAKDELIEKAIESGEAKLLPPGSKAVSEHDLHRVHNDAFDIRANTEETIIAGYSVVSINNNVAGETNVVKTFTIEGAAREYALKLSTESPNRTYGVEPLERPVVDGVAARVYFSKDLAKMLRANLAKDHFRENSIAGVSGRRLIRLKNLSTSVEFAFSIFHAFTISQEMMASFASHSMQTKKGFDRLSGFNLFKSSNDVKRISALVVSMLENPKIAEREDFKKEAERLIGPNATDLMSLVEQFYRVGGRMQQDDDLRSDLYNYGKTHYKSEVENYVVVDDRLVFNKGKLSAKAVADSIKKVHEDAIRNEPDKHVKAMFKAVSFAGLQSTTEWLMEDLIPKVKMAAWLKEYTLRLKQQEHLIKSGKMSKESIADNTLKFVEDRFGEVNWAQQWMNPTYKSLLQFTFRSFTWFTGSWKAISKAGVDVSKLGWFTLKGQGIGSKDPNRQRLTEKGLWGINAVISHMMVASMVSAAYMAVAAGSDDEVPTEEEIPIMTRLLFPRADVHDPESRLAVPSYVTEAYKIFHHIGLMGTEFEPSKLISGRLNSFVGNFAEAMNGEDFRGVVIRDAKDPVFKQAFDVLTHTMSVAPISFSSIHGTWQRKGFDPKSVIYSMFGMTQAPAVAKRSDAANYAFQLAREQFSGMRVEKEDMVVRDKVSRAAYAFGEGDRDPLQKLLKEGEISPQKYLNALKRIPRIDGKPNPRYIKPLINAYKRLTMDGALEVWDYATDKEKKELKPLLFQKYTNAVSRRTMSTEEQKEALNTMKEKGII